MILKLIRSTYGNTFKYGPAIPGYNSYFSSVVAKGILQRSGLRLRRRLSAFVTKVRSFPSAFVRYVEVIERHRVRPLFVGIMFFIRHFQKWYAGGRVITIIHYTFLKSKVCQIMTKVIMAKYGEQK